MAAVTNNVVRLMSRFGTNKNEKIRLNDSCDSELSECLCWHVDNDGRSIESEMNE